MTVKPDPNPEETQRMLDSFFGEDAENWVNISTYDPERHGTLEQWKEHCDRLNDRLDKLEWQYSFDPDVHGTLENWLAIFEDDLK